MSGLEVLVTWIKTVVRFDPPFQHERIPPTRKSKLSHELHGFLGLERSKSDRIF
jgi:hypothetical protein